MCSNPAAVSTLEGSDGELSDRLIGQAFSTATAGKSNVAVGAATGVASPSSSSPEEENVGAPINRNVSKREEGPNGEPDVPTWDSQRRELRINGTTVKRFKWTAVNQEAVLAVFEEEGWPLRIDDPLPPHPEQNSKRRLSDTIKCLNRKQQNKRIHFRGDGAGEGVTWELVGQDGSDDAQSG